MLLCLSFSVSLILLPIKCFFWVKILTKIHEHLKKLYGNLEKTKKLQFFDNKVIVSHPQI